MPKQVVSIRLSEENIQWLRENVGEGDRTVFFEGLLTTYRETEPFQQLMDECLAAYRARRLLIAAWPAPKTPNRGDDPAHPILTSDD